VFLGLSKNRLRHHTFCLQESHAVAGKPRDAAVNSDRYQVCWHFAGAISAGVLGQLSAQYKSDLHVLLRLTYLLACGRHNSQFSKSSVNAKLKISLNIFGHRHCPQPILLRIMNIQAIQSQPRSYISGSVERRQGIK